MKLVQKFLALLLLSFAFLTACGDHPPNNPSNNITPSAGKWKVAYFFDKQDETSNYSSYTFEFQANGTLIASNGNQTFSGTWTTGIDNSSDMFLIDFRACSGIFDGA